MIKGEMFSQPNVKGMQILINLPYIYTIGWSNTIANNIY